MNISDEFCKVMRDFLRDMRNTFPEFEPLIKKYWKDESFFSHIEDKDEREKTLKESESKSLLFLFKFCQKKYPPRFFDILYQNDSIFKEDSDFDTEFLPHIHFKNLWQFEISQQTRETIWKYLQLITFSIVGSIENKEAFGDAAKLFEAINADEFKSKLEETMDQMKNIFENFQEPSAEEQNDFNMPKPEDIHNHINGMMNGKLGRLAKEIAEETAADLDLDLENTKDVKEVFNKLIKNPTKLMGLVKSVGSKIENKIKSGEIKESELMEEATDIMNKMKDMPGMGNIQSMLNKMGMGGGKVNMGAMKSKLNTNLRMAKMKERMKEKVEKKAQESASEEKPTVFSTGEAVEKTPRGTQKPVEKKKKNKNKK
jgi:hypothetical protein